MNKPIVRILLMLFLTMVALLVVIGLVRGNAHREAMPNGWRAASEIGLPFKYAALLLKEPDEQLLMPVGGVRVRQVANTWGAPRVGGRSHAGQDIFARRGTPVYSATEGYVLHVGESPVGGKTVFIFGAGGRRYYYAHLHEHAPDLAVGDPVTPATLLGYVGATGNAKGTPPHLHFGVYGATGALNPLPLLADRINTLDIQQGGKQR